MIEIDIRMKVQGKDIWDTHQMLLADGCFPVSRISWVSQISSHTVFGIRP